MLLKTFYENQIFPVGSYTIPSNLKQHQCVYINMQDASVGKGGTHKVGVLRLHYLRCDIYSDPFDKHTRI